MKSVRMVLVAAAFLLAGCWSSEELLLDPDRAESALRTGTWRSGEEVMTIKRASKGRFELGDGGTGRQAILFNRLPDRNGMKVYAFALQEWDCYMGSDKCVDSSFYYGIMRVQGSTAYRLRPDCSETAALAEKWGAVVEKDEQGNATACKFTTRDAVIGALDELAQTGPEGQMFKR